MPRLLPCALLNRDPDLHALNGRPREEVQPSEERIRFWATVIVMRDQLDTTPSMVGRKYTEDRDRSCSEPQPQPQHRRFSPTETGPGLRLRVGILVLRCERKRKDASSTLGVIGSEDVGVLRPVTTLLKHSILISWVLPSSYDLPWQLQWDGSSLDPALSLCRRRRSKPHSERRSCSEMMYERNVIEYI
jgi:hypothetical protein